MEKICDGTSERKEGGVIQRWCSGDAAHAVRAEELSRHRVNGRWAEADTNFSTADATNPRGLARVC